jgi:hypothetical protein
MEYSSAATPPRAAIENNKYTISRSQRSSISELPLKQYREQYLVDNKLVPPDYQPVFESTKLLQQVPIVEDKMNYGESSQEEQVKQLREIVMLLKYLLLVCGLVFTYMTHAGTGSNNIGSQTHTRHMF